MYVGLFSRAELFKDLPRQGVDLNAKNALGNSATQLADSEIRMLASH